MSRLPLLSLWVSIALLSAAAPARAVSVFVQHLGDVTRSPVLAIDSGTGFDLEADLISGVFKGYAEGSPGVPVSNNFAGTEQSLLFTNLGPAPILIPAGALIAHVETTYSHGPPIGTATGGANNTITRTGGSLIVDVLGGSGQASFLAIGNHQITVLYNIDGSVRQTIESFTPTERGGALVAVSAADTFELIMDLLMPALVIDPGARLRIGFQMQIDASDASTNNALNSAHLSLLLPAGAVLSSDAGQPLDWVRTVPEPSAFALVGLAALAFLARARRAYL